MTRTRIGWSLAGVLALAGTVVGLMGLQGGGANETGNGQAAVAPQKVVIDVLEIVPFELSQPMTHWWRAERPTFTRGVLMALETDPAWLIQRQVATPLLFCGGETVQILNHGHESGRAIVVVPFFENEPPAALMQRPLYFGSTRLAEQVTAADAAQELKRAVALGAAPMESDAFQRALKPGLRLAGEVELFREAGRLVQTYSSSETETIQWLTGGN